MTAPSKFETDLVGCQCCGGSDVTVYDSRTFIVGKNRTKARHKKCRTCGYRFKTMEVAKELAIDLFTDD